MRFPIALGTQSNKGKSPLEGIARLINCRAEVVGDEQRVKVSTHAVAGLTALGTLSGSGGVRAMIEVDGVGYAVCGRVVHQFEAGGTSTVLGGMPSDGLVTMARNSRAAGAQTMIVCDGLGKFIQGGAVVDITDTDFGSPNSVCSVANHFVTSSPDGYLRASEINDATGWDGLAITAAQSDPDGLLRAVSRGTSVIAFGQRSFEVWDYTGSNDGFPFQRSQSSRVGCWSAASVVSAPIIRPDLVTDAIAWATTDKDGAYAAISILDGYTARPISRPDVDRDMRDCADPSTIVGMSWTDAGHAYMAWTIPGVTTWVYDTATSLWHERQSYGQGHWNIGTTMVLGGRVVGGHRSSPNLYFVDPSANDEAGTQLVMTVQTPPVHAFPDQIETNALYLDCVTGVGLNTTTPADLDPMVTMAMSRDGETWGTELSRALGRQGNSNKRLAWHALGTSDHRGISYKFSASAKVVKTFLSIAADGAKIAA